MAKSNPITVSKMPKPVSPLTKTMAKTGKNNPINIGAGYVLSGAPESSPITQPIPNLTAVRALEPFGTKMPTLLYDRTSGYAQTANRSHNFDFKQIQAAMRSAENGDTRPLFGFYRDFILGNPHIVAEFTKRKLSTLSKPWNIIPDNKNDPDDIHAAKVIEDILRNYDGLNEALEGAMNAIIYPVSVLEKTFLPAEEFK